MGEKSHVELRNQTSEMVRLMRTEKKKLAGEISEVRPDKMCARSGPTPLQQDCVFQIWSSIARCNRTVYVSFRSKDSRCGATPLLRDWVRVNRYTPDRLYCYIQELSLSGGREILRSEQEVNTLQIWSNTSTICGLIRSQDSIIQI